MVNSIDKTISIKMNDEFISRLDRIANIGGISRHQFIRNLLYLGVEELEKFEFVGAFPIGILLRDIHESIMKKRKKVINDPVSGEKPIPVKLDESFLKRLDRLADRAGLTRNILMRNILRVEIEEAESMATFGLLQFYTFMRDLPETFKKICEQGETALNATKKMNS